MKNFILVLCIAIGGLVLWKVFANKQPSAPTYTQESQVTPAPETLVQQETIAATEAPAAPITQEQASAPLRIIEVKDDTATPEEKTSDFKKFVSMVSTLKTVLGETGAEKDTREWEKSGRERLETATAEQKIILNKLGSSRHAERLKLLFLAATNAESANSPETLSYLKQTQREFAKSPTESFQLVEQALRALPDDYFVQKRALILIAEGLPGKKEEAKSLCQRDRSVASLCE